MKHKQGDKVKIIVDNNILPKRNTEVIIAKLDSTREPFPYLITTKCGLTRWVAEFEIE